VAPLLPPARYNSLPSPARFPILPRRGFFLSGKAYIIAPDVERLRYRPNNRHSLLRRLWDPNTPGGPDPRSWVAQADMYLEEYGPDAEIEEASQRFRDRLAGG
jgi:hypothetical protein